MTSLMNPVATSLRRIARHAERVNRRIAMMDIPGKVIPGSQDMDVRKLRLDLGRSADGRVIKSPPISWPQQGAGTLKLHHRPKNDEQMRMRSPSGTVGTGSSADHSTYDDDNKPPSKKGDEAVFEFAEKSRITMREDKLVIEIGESAIVMTEEGIAFLGRQASITGALKHAGPFEIVGDLLTHNGANVGSSHVHDGIQRGGSDTDPPH